MNWVQKLRKLLKDIRNELNKVHWPTRKQITVFSGIVISTIVVIGAFFWLLDTGFTAILRVIL